MTPCSTGTTQLLQQQQQPAQTDPLLTEAHRAATLFQQNSTCSGASATPNHYPQGILRSSISHGGGGTATTMANNIGGSNHVAKKAEFRDMGPHGNNMAMKQLNLSQMNIPNLREPEMTTFTGGSLKRPHHGGAMVPHANSVGSAAGVPHHLATLPRVGSIGGLTGNNMRLVDPHQQQQFNQHQYPVHNQNHTSHGQQGCQQSGIQEIRV